MVVIAGTTNALDTSAERLEIEKFHVFRRQDDDKRYEYIGTADIAVIKVRYSFSIQSIISCE